MKISNFLENTFFTKLDEPQVKTINFKAATIASIILMSLGVYVQNCMASISPLIPTRVRFNEDQLVIIHPGNITHDLPCLPTFETSNLEQESDLDTFVQNGLLYTKDAYSKYLNLPKAVINTKEQADQIVQQLSKEQFFAWEYAKDGCGHRAPLTFHVLEAMGINKNKFVQQFIHCLPESLRSMNDEYRAIGTVFQGDTITWNYHTAAAIILPDDMKYILDPSVDKDHALEIDDWINRITINKQLINKCNVSEKLFKITDLIDIDWILLKSNREKLKISKL